ncbi:SAM-dependent methyltransferase [Bacteroidia bacterium]|nr:SAM-dependent methyltransferase [Bacteroidia bacterium]
MTILECPICKTKNISFYTHTKDYQYPKNSDEYAVYRCPDCQILFQHPFPKPEDFDKIYPKDYYAHVETGKIPFLLNLLDQFLNNQKWLFKPIKRSVFPYFNIIKNAEKVLDIGCGKGIFLDILKKSGKETHGLEPDTNALKILKNKGHHTFAGDIFTATIEDNSFDLVTMFQVFEHIEEPACLVHEVYRILKPGGYFVFETPNSASQLAGNKNFWRSLELPRHLILHSPKSVENLLLKENFQPEIFVRVSPGDVKSSYFLKHNMTSPAKRKLISLLLLPYIVFQYLFNASAGSLLIVIAKK